MKKIKFMSGGIIIAFSLVSNPAPGQISKNLSFSIPDVGRKTLKKHGADYEWLQMTKAYHSPEVGEPSLPVYDYRFYVPKGQKVTGAVFNGNSYLELQFDADLFPGQHVTTTSSAYTDTVFDLPDPAVYSKDAYYPDVQAKVIRSDFVDGDMEIVTVQVRPVQYNPKTRKVKLASNGVLSILTVSGSSLNSALFDIARSSRHSSFMTNFVKSIVENSGDVPKPAVSVQEKVKTNNLKSGSVSWSVPFYEYTVVTSKALTPAFAQFITWKRRKGLNAGVVCIEDILNDPVASGDSVSKIFDKPGKLRQYFQALWTYNKNNGVPATFVLLGGDSAIVPVRYGCGTENSWWKSIIGGYTDAHIPTDLYYSDLIGNWNVDKDEYYGEFTGEIMGNDIKGDSVDFGPEIFVGRLMCTTESDLKTWTTKALLYEQNPGGNDGDYTYVQKMLLTEADFLASPPQDPIYYPQFFANSLTKSLSESPSDNDPAPTGPTGNQVITFLNQNFGYYSVSNHGSPTSFQLATPGDNQGTTYEIVALDSYDNEQNNGFDGLTNYDYPTIIYSHSCYNMPFDNKGTAGTGKINLGESFTTYNKGGGVAYLGNTRAGIFGEGNQLENKFLDSIETYPQLGIAESKSKIGFGDYFTVFTHNLLGDPEMPMWTGRPITSFGHVSISNNNKTVTVNIDTEVDRISIVSALNNGYDSVTRNTNNAIFHNVNIPYYLTLSKKNYMPKLIRYPNGNLYIQNQTLGSIAYLDWKSTGNYTISAGFNVDPTQNTGNVVIQNGANIVFDATGDILLDKGFEVQLGAYFEAK